MVRCFSGSWSVVVVSSVALAALACASATEPRREVPGPTPPTGSVATDGGTSVAVPTTDESGDEFGDEPVDVARPPSVEVSDASAGVSTVEIFETLPEGFLPADETDPETSKGGLKLLGPLAEVSAPEGECGNILRIIVRDFQGTHDDFENASDWNRYEVQTPIGATRKPVKVSDTGPTHFEEWYQNVEGTNLPFAVDLWLEPVNGVYVFDSTAFFPLHDVGYNDTYLFTTELHTNFVYREGDVFTFRGDDDVFVFINGHEAVNLSGVHIAEEATVSLDEVAEDFGLELGNGYTFDLFQAERQPSGSNFRLETTLDFTGCAEILPTDVIIQ